MLRKKMVRKELNGMVILEELIKGNQIHREESSIPGAVSLLSTM